jgi:hypothetical protein
LDRKQKLTRNSWGDWVFQVRNDFYDAMRESLGVYDHIDSEDAFAAWDGL